MFALLSRSIVTGTNQEEAMLKKALRLFIALCVAMVAVLASIGAGLSRASDTFNLSDEQEIGRQVFEELKGKGEIVSSSPLSEPLRPIEAAITRTAQPYYGLPFKFYLVHEPSPNAFATPGGNVYVTDSLLYFVRNTEELAGTICHEVSHTIHHDSMALIEKERRIQRREIGAAVLLGPSIAHILAIQLIGKLNSLGYSREAESAADLTGSDVCAGSGYNPWGLVWLFQDFDKADLGQLPQILSDHPSNANRVQALKQHFRAKPAVFAKFNPDPKSAKPIAIPKDATEQFLR
jgi:predicted Zn-dependent protease